MINEFASSWRRLRRQRRRGELPELPVLQGVEDVLGHSSPQVTKMIYIDVADKIPRDAVERLGYLFDEGPEQ